MQKHIEEHIMKRMLSTLLASTLLLGALPALANPATVIQPAQPAFFQAAKKSTVQMDYTHFQLKNGLNVYLSRNPQEPRFYAQVVVNAGGKQDPADATGIAHYLEHMLFKGTSRLGTVDFAKEKALQDQIVARYEELFQTTDEARREALQKEINQLSIAASQYAIPGELDSLYSRLGAQGLNAYTSNEETVYLLSLPKNRLEQWAMIESERFREPVFRLFQSELETVYEEKNRSMDNKEGILWEAVEAQLYKQHPYGTQTILGSVEHLKNPSLNKMYAFYRQYYVPNNMALVISGDIDINETRKIIETHFSSWEPGPTPKFEPPAEPPLQGVERVKVQYAGEEKVMLAFRTAPQAHADRDALAMIDMLLDSGSAGLLKLNLVQPQKVRSAGSYPMFLNDHGAQYLYAVPKEGQSLAEAEKLLLEQLEVIKQGSFDEEIMQAVALDFEISRKRAVESNEGRGSILTHAFLRGQSVEDQLAQPARLRALRKADVVRVAQKYFGSDYVSGYREDAEYTFPKITKPELESVPLNPNQQSAFAAGVEARQPKPVEPQWLDIRKELKASSYAPGVLYYHARNPVNDLFSFSLSYDYGNKHHPHFCSVMSELNHAGTAEMSSSEVANAFFKLGVQAKFSCGDYGFSLNLQGTDPHFEKSLALAQQVLWSAQLDPERFAAKIENQLTSRTDEKKDLQTLRQALRNWVRFDQESGFLDRPSAAELKQASIDKYPAMREALQKQNFKISYVGQLPMKRVENLVRKYHQPQEIPVPLLNPRKAPPLKLQSRHQDPVRIYFLHHASAQSNIDLVIPGELTQPAEAVLNSYYNQYMDGGMGAIMFQEVRESRALAYSTWAHYFSGSRLGDQEQLLAYIGTQGDKTVDSLKLLIELIQTPPKSANHFERAHKALDNHYRTSRVAFREIFGTVEAWADLGLDQDPRPAQFAQLEAVKLEDIFAYIDQKVTGKPLTFTVVGDKDKIGLDALRKLGTVVEVQKEQLFRD